VGQGKGRKRGDGAKEAAEDECSVESEDCRRHEGAVGKVQGGKEERLESVLLQMSEAQNWAQAQMGAAILRGAPRRQPPTEDEAPLLVQIVTGNVFFVREPGRAFFSKNASFDA